MPILPLNLTDPDPDDDARGHIDDRLLPSRDAAHVRDSILSDSDSDDSDNSNNRDLPRDSTRLQLRDDPPPVTDPAAFGSFDDNAILHRINMGAEDSLGALYDRYGKLVYSVALRVLRDPTAAEDVLCEIFMDIWRKSDNYLAIRGPLGGWLAVLARNRAIDALRRKRPINTMEDILLASNFDLSQEPERNTLSEKARSVLRALPTDQRKTLEMAFFDGLTHSEIAEMTDDSDSNIRTRLRSALLTLRKAMQA
jgi:RNA polymerase sigma-70 factor (ECF subfamily)